MTWVHQVLRFKVEPREEIKIETTKKVHLKIILYPELPSFDLFTYLNKWSDWGYPSNLDLEMFCWNYLGFRCNPCTCEGSIPSWNGLHGSWRFWGSKEWFPNGSYNVIFKLSGRKLDSWSISYPVSVYYQMIKVDKSSEPDATATLAKLKKREQVC